MLHLNSRAWGLGPEAWGVGPGVGSSFSTISVSRSDRNEPQTELFQSLQAHIHIRIQFSGVCTRMAAGSVRPPSRAKDH